VDPLHISRLAEARNLKFGVLIEGWGPNQKHATGGHRESGTWSPDQLLIFGPIRISAMAKAGHSGACGVCRAFDAAVAKLL